MNVKSVLDSYKILDIELRPEFMKEDAIKLAHLVKPEWNKSKIQTKFFTDGTTNQLMGCYLNDDENNIILIRIYGLNTQLFIDRNQEIENLQLMNKYYLSPPLFASFQNGICYGYNQGKVITQEMIKNEKISFNVCKMMAKMHSISFHEKKNQKSTHACLFNDLNKYLNLIMPSTLNFLPNHELFESITIKSLKKEINFLEANLVQLDSPIVFAHNDLLLKNIIYNQKNENISFIDFEYANFNFQAFDIANHFCEFAGNNPYNSSLYPDKKFQLKWLQNYLYFWKYYQSLSLNYSQKDKIYQDVQDNHDNYNAVVCDNNIDENVVDRNNHDVKINLLTHSNQTNSNNYHNGKPYDVSDDQINKLYIQVTKFTLASHLFWGVWALLQSQFSSIEFDFKKYGLSRIKEYFLNKDKILFLKF